MDFKNNKIAIKIDCDFDMEDGGKIRKSTVKALEI